MNTAKRVVEESSAPFNFDPKGRVSTNWRAMGAVITVAALGAGFYFTQQDHTKRLDKLEAKVDIQHDLLIEIRTAVKK